MKQLFLVALGLAAGATLTLFGLDTTFSNIDFPGGATTQAWGINSRGDIIGVYTLADKSSHGFLLSGSHYTALDFPGAAVTLANGIGPRGDVVGEYGTTLTSPHHGFVLSSQGIFTPIDFPGAAVTFALGMDARGDILGGYTLADNVNHGFLLSGGRYTTVDFPGAAGTVMGTINAQGDIVGSNADGKGSHAFLLRNGVYTTWDHPNAAGFTNAVGMNSAGDVVGRYRDAAGVVHAYELSAGKFTSYDALGATFTGFTSIDSSGNIVGRYQTGGVFHGLLLSTPHPVTRYVLTDLGPVGGAPGQPYILADNGLSAGAAAAADGTTHAVLWNKGIRSDLATPGLGGLNSIALGVNNKGQAAGAAESSTPDPNGEDFCGFKTDELPSQGTKCLPFLWQSGAMTPLPTLGGGNGSASWTNNRGDVVGVAENLKLDPTCPSPQKYQFKPVIWDRGQIQELPTFGSDVNGVAVSINDSGQTVGGSGDCSTLQPNGSYLLSRHALLWEEGGVTDLGNLGGTGKGSGILALDINNLGQAVGYSDLPGDKVDHGFLWSRLTGMMDLGTLPGDVSSVAIGINDAGEVVGISFDAENNLTAFVSQRGVMTDLNALIPGDSSLFLFLASAINSRGQIVGLGANEAGEAHAFLLTPTGGVEESLLRKRAAVRPRFKGGRFNSGRFTR